MRRLLLAVAGILLLSAVGITVALALTPERGPPRFTEAEAERIMEAALERCAPRERHGMVTCELSGGRFSCRAAGGYTATFGMPDPAEPEIEVSC